MQKSQGSHATPPLVAAARSRHRWLARGIPGNPGVFARCYAAACYRRSLVAYPIAAAFRDALRSLIFRVSSFLAFEARTGRRRLSLCLARDISLARIAALAN